MNQHVDPAPFLHDRWEDQVELEKSMLSMGRERTKTRIDRAKKKHDMTRLRPYRNLLQDWILPVGEGVRLWVEKAKAKRGVRPVALHRIELLDHNTAALVALRMMLRRLGLDRAPILAIAEEIGTWCEHEARCAKWKEEEPEDWKLTARQYATRGSNSAHQRRSRIALFTRFVWEKIGWIEWTKQDRQRVGLELINIVIEVTKRFYIAPDPAWGASKKKGGVVLARPYLLFADAETLNWLTSAMDDELVHQPVYLPTLIPPLDWTGPRDGGYYTPFAKPPFLIRFTTYSQDMKRQAMEEYEALDMPGVYAAINAVQHTGWTINRRVLEIAQQVWDADLAIAGLSSKEPLVVPPRPEGASPESEAYKSWAKNAAERHVHNAKLFSTVISYRRALVCADRFKEEPTFYFPHMLDFRGRMYPIPSDLSPQGGDLHRGLLTFANPKPVTRECAGWLAVHLANVHGVDKCSNDDRIKWVMERERFWRDIAADPLANRDWADEDDPWQCLAAIFEWVRWLDEGEGMMSSLPIRVDGTCNGIQHLSAMVRDEVAGKLVNLLPAPKPQDIYQEVADMLTPIIYSKIPHAAASFWLEVFQGQAPRSVTKRPVMILPYGGTTHAYFGYTLEWLDDNYEDFGAMPRKEKAAMVNWLVPILWDAVGARVETARKTMKWLVELATKASASGKPLWWVTPAGFYVRQFYGSVESTRVRTMLDGQLIKLRSQEYTPTLDVEDQAQAIAPNFVHSMDASALMSCVNLAMANGVQSITTIHDAYGTVAADMEVLNACIRQAFVETYREPVLEQFREACLDVCGAAVTLPEVPAMGTLDIEQVLTSEYFFA